MTNEKILALRCALLIAVSEAEKVQNTEDDGTCNFDTPALILDSKWKYNHVVAAFNLTGLRPYKAGKHEYHILGAVTGQGAQRTAMAEAFRDSLKASGYNAYVHYQMD